MITLHPNSNEQKRLNLEHLNNPKVGDYWHEMFEPICVVVSVLENEKKVLVCTTTKDVDKGAYCTYDLSQLKTMKFKEFKDELTYSSDSTKTWCDVIPECHKWVKDEAKKIMFGD